MQETPRLQHPKHRSVSESTAIRFRSGVTKVVGPIGQRSPRIGTFPSDVDHLRVRVVDHAPASLTYRLAVIDFLVVEEIARVKKANFARSPRDALGNSTPAPSRIRAPLRGPMTCRLLSGWPEKIARARSWLGKHSKASESSGRTVAASRQAPTSSTPALHSRGWDSINSTVFRRVSGDTIASVLSNSR